MTGTVCQSQNVGSGLTSFILFSICTLFVYFFYLKIYNIFMVSGNVHGTFRMSGQWGRNLADRECRKELQEREARNNPVSSFQEEAGKKIRTI